MGLVQSIRVAGALQLGHGQSQRFNFQRGKLPEEGFVLRWGDALYAFANSCPHWSVDLDYGTARFVIQYDDIEQVVVRKG